MKKRLLILSLVVLVPTLVSQAQDNKKLRVGVGAGFTIVEAMGFLWAVEPGYRLSKDWVLGIRIEGAGTDMDFNGFTNKIVSFTANAQYYLNDKRVRPLIGAGLGYYDLTLSYFGHDSKFGFYPRVGVEFGHMFLDVDYNIMSSTEAVDIDFTIKNSYLSVRYGLLIGGGKREK